MKTIIKKINALEVSDIEKVMSDFLEEPVKISDIECTLTYWVDDNNLPTQMFLDFGSCDANDLFYDEELGGYYLNDERLGLSEPWLPLNELFAFDVSEFGSFTVETSLEWN